MREAAARFGDREFLRCPDASLSFRQVDEDTDRLCAAMTAHGVGPGDRVAIMMDNVSGWPLGWFSVLKAGAVAVPANARYRESDLEFVLRDSGAVMALAGPEHAKLVRTVGARVETVRVVRTLRELAAEAPQSPGAGAEAAGPDHSEIANFQYTSGTTGFPKACMLTHDYWIRTAWLVAMEAELRTDDVVIMAQAFSYMDPQWTALLCLMGGLPLVVLPRFSASGFWRSARDHGATITYLLGTMPMLLFRQPRAPEDRRNRMRLVLCSGIPPDMHRSFEDRWGAPWREVYGSTESGLDLIVAPDAVDSVGSGAIGVPPDGKEVRVVDENGAAVPNGEVGEIVVRGKPMMTGYWNHPEATAHAFGGGWFHTGDLGYRDPLGRFHHAGRIKDIIRRGGENISAAEVESVLARHPAVLAVALVPVPDELFGEVPKAFVQIRPGTPPSTDTAESIVEHARRHLARFKVPAYLEFVDGFAMTPSARVQKRELLVPERDQRSGSYEIATSSWI
ncbi:ATP-dependent acyl-CoA ligase [Actinomadura soli]|uniref:ATP-dependent acyl-CoA ligase n=1 Tax=Actinomadura soli TaxID=2508997 RepID=A0A5C4JCF9_9ACTN|nr:ATP-dependent acyl-CoA ligase [Actinomadura soli]